jgi:hypothetical protein
MATVFPLARYRAHAKQWSVIAVRKEPFWGAPFICAGYCRQSR